MRAYGGTEYSLDEMGQRLIDDAVIAENRTLSSEKIMEMMKPYYTKSQVDELLDKIKSLLENFYTKQQIDSTFYTKGQIEELNTVVVIDAGGFSAVTVDGGSFGFTPKDVIDGGSFKNIASDVMRSSNFALLHSKRRENLCLPYSVMDGGTFNALAKNIVDGGGVIQ